MNKQYFEPDAKYIMTAIRDPGVYGYVSEHRYREPVYMVIGLVVAAAPHTVGEQSRDSNFRGRVGAVVSDAVNVEPSFGASHDDEGMSDSIVNGDLVVAFSLTRIKVRKSGEERSSRVTNDGRLLGLEDVSLTAHPATMDFDVEAAPVSGASIDDQRSTFAAGDEDGDVFEYIDVGI